MSMHLKEKCSKWGTGDTWSSQATLVGQDTSHYTYCFNNIPNRNLTESHIVNFTQRLNIQTGLCSKLYCCFLLGKQGKNTEANTEKTFTL